MASGAGDQMLLAYLGQFKSQLDRIENEMDRTDERFDALKNEHQKLDTRLTVLETWRAAATVATNSRQWLVGAILGGLALVISLLGVAFGR